MNGSEDGRDWHGFSSLPDGYRAIVVGASGGIGSAICRLLQDDPRIGELITFSRSVDGFDITDEASVAKGASSAVGRSFHLLFCATGILTSGHSGPEKSLRQISPDTMMENFRVNAVGPALVAKYFLPLLDKDNRSIAAFLSARVGSIGDNRLGGWISYRASKAALNQIVRTSSIELSRTHPDSVVVAMHPGTVETPLSSPYSRNHEVMQPKSAAGRMLGTLDHLDRRQGGSFVAYDGKTIVW